MARASQSGPHRTFVILFALVSALTCIAVIALNSMVDPLWYFGGNLLTGKNYAFNERQSKLNQLLHDPERYDCLIFGSSRSTLLPADALAPYRCFNLSFSGGQVEEFIAFARYLKHKGLRPRYVVVGVDGFNFLESGRDALSIPDHVKNMQAAPSFIRSYLSLDALHLTLRTLTGDSPLPRYYDRRFDAQIKRDVPAFHPERSIEGEGLHRADAEARRKQHFVSDNANRYAQLAAVFPNALAVSYVPPVSAWHVAEMDKNGVLPSYIDALYATASRFPVFIDFSMPSSVTWRTDNTYDGSHYGPEVNRSIARTLLAGAPQEWGSAPTTIGLEAYRQRYRAALDRFARRPVPAR
jgi:hypothetical protein